MKKLFIILTIITVSSFYLAAGDTVTVNGYYKLFFTGFKMPTVTGTDASEEVPPMGSVNNRLRLKLTITPADWFSVHAAYDFSPRIQDPLLFTEDIFFGAIDPFSYRVDDFPQRLYPASGKAVSSLGIYHNLDRLFVTIKTSKADIFIGRQAIAWGSARFVNPTDVIAPFTFNELDTEERHGVDAVRVRVPLGMMSELDMGYIFGRKFHFENSAFYLRGKTYFLKTDLSLLLLGFRENLLIGLDVARSIGQAGFWFESAYVIPDVFAGDEETGKAEDFTGNYFRASVGMDYNFSGKVYGFFEYHFNSAGRKDSADYPDVFTTTAFLEGASYLMGRHYLNLGVTTQITPLIPFSSALIFNLNDWSLNFAPSVEYNIKEDIYIAVGAYLSIGKRPEVCDVCNPALQYRFHSEFGAYPNMVYSSLRIYF